MLQMALLSSSRDPELIKPRACPAAGRDGHTGVGLLAPTTPPLTQDCQLGLLVASPRNPS